MKTFYKSKCCGVDSVDLRHSIFWAKKNRWFCYVRIGYTMAYAIGCNKFEAVRNAKIYLINKIQKTKDDINRR